HFAKGERVADRAEIDHVAEPDTRDRRTHRPATHRKARFIELDRLTVAEDREPAIDVDLRDHGREARLDLVLLVPMRIQHRQLFQRRDFVAEETLGKHPAFVRWRGLRADERDLAALVVLADALARAAAAHAAPNDKIIALNHVQADDRKSVRLLAREKLEHRPADDDGGDDAREVA